ATCLNIQDRERLDLDLCSDSGTLHGHGDCAVAGAATRWCAKENPQAVVDRQTRAERGRSVWLRPAPEAMAYLTALVPMVDGVSAFATLSRQADTARAAGEARTRGQIMADTLLTAVTGRPEGEP